MIRARRTSALVLGVVATLALAGTPPALAQPDPPVPGVPQLDLRPAPPTLAFPGARAAGLDWRACLGNLQEFRLRCATLEVPLDHNNPSGPTIELAISRVRHTVPERKYRGVVVVNPGGPGGSGLPFATIGSQLPRKTAAAYDWIGFDPRGVGASTPVLSCDPDYFGFDRPNYFPRPKANQRAWVQRSRGYAKDCAANGDILRHLTTADTAKDVEALRVALGARRINFYGFSYGSYLGQVYATLFPQRVRRMVLDSNVNPRQVFYEANLRQNPAIDRVFRKWFGWIAEYQDVFRLGGSAKAVARRFVRTSERLAERPARGKVGSSEWIDLFLPVAYTTGEWDGMARLWSRYERTGKGKLLVAAYRTSGVMGDDNSYAVYTGVQCTDAPWPTDWSTWAKDNWRSYDKAPLTTWMNAWFNAPCRHWPVSPRARFHVEGDDVKGGPLLVGGTLDGATPFRNSKVVRTMFPRSRLVAIQGEPTHAASLDGNRCVVRIVARYLRTGDLPPRRPGKQPDVRCAALPLPTAVTSAKGNG